VTGAGSDTFTLTMSGERELVMSRVFDAPRKLVFEAHSSCEHVSKWWGGGSHIMASCEMDFRPGGKWRFVLRDADGHEFGFHGEFREIVAPARLVWTFEYEGMPGHVSVETLTLEEHDGKTTVTGRSVFDSTEDRDGMVASGMEAGARETWDSLAAYVEAMS
jgi:uncharacterized protein YndB with AHSA1/START domain